ncbi:glycosyltransferase family 2 protein [Microbacterium betulae]|uniref:Glycosyltransferase family 2 protein n=1 Tax=Microbacterium betulae TaxID=2981139 RepID=A0AA97FH92_9MICO|nr:glycosyltransferase family 2 protein [Microbacterium sp. AB]WOF22638.1 glycosyltransferase family 2 protein [Microbacterium sp. AB]
MTPLVTVVVATRDRPQLLRRAVRSILAQDVAGRIEIVLVFDGSPVDPLADLGPGRHAVRPMANTRAPGLAGARNTGVLAASAPLVAFCDDDDEWLPGKLAAQLPLLDDPGVVLAATGIRIRSSGGEHDRLPPASVGLGDLLRSRITELHPSSFLLRTADLRGRLGLVDEDLPASYGEDYDLLLRAAGLGRVAAVAEPLTIVHWDRTSYFSERWRGIVDGLGYLLDKHPEFARSTRGRARIEGQIAFAHGALGAFRSARHWAGRSLRDDLRQPRAYLALCVGLRLVSGERVVAALNARGRGM